MPTQRTISCDHCGFMLRKKDTTCEQCGLETAYSKRLFKLAMLNFAVAIIGALIAYFVVQHVVQGLRSGPTMVQRSEPRF
jgi:hypothetical protein